VANTHNNVSQQCFHLMYAVHVESDKNFLCDFLISDDSFKLHSVPWPQFLGIFDFVVNIGCACVILCL